MNRVLGVLLLLCFLPVAAIAGGEETPAVLYRAGLESYRNARYRQAMDAFQRLLDRGYSSFDLHYNLGNAAYKNGDLGLSVLSYERARVLDPGNEDVIHNLRVVRARLRDRIDPIPLLFFLQWWNDLKTGARPETLAYWSLGFFTLFAVSAFVFFGIPQLTARRIALVMGLVFFAGSATTLIVSLQRSADIHAHRDAVVMRSEVTVRSAPDATGVESFLVHEGLKVRILESRDHHVRIRLDDGKTGWIDQSALERI
ncbi:MAG: tetratricopeptide repeat protein [Bacteroidota bacterium]|jgi:hypothetical protein|nr:tetratricopeptide repeat protein [Bacteroidota bacterium]